MAIDVREISRSFGRTPALDGVTLRVEEGERVALVGRNGAGKTTLLRVLATVLPAESGVGTVSGFDLFADQAAIRAITGYLPEGDPADHALTAREWLRFRGRLRRMPRRRLRRRMHEVASFFGLAPLLGTRVGALSNGQRRAVAIAEALLTGMPVVISDQTPWRNLEAANAGWDLPLDDLSAFAAAIQQMADMDGEAYRAKCAAARKYVSEKIRLDALIDSYLQMLTER